MTPENDLKFKYQGPLAQFYWNIVLPIGFHGANGAMTAEGSSCDRGLLAHTVWNICHPALDRGHLPTPAEREPLGPVKGLLPWRGGVRSGDSRSDEGTSQGPTPAATGLVVIEGVGVTAMTGTHHNGGWN